MAMRSSAFYIGRLFKKYMDYTSSVVWEFVTGIFIYIL